MVFWRKSKKEKPKEAMGKEAVETSGEGVKDVRAEKKNEEKKDGASVFGVLERPHITEKTAAAGKENKYVFAVGSGANKPQIKKAVEARYGVKVSSVNILNMPGKERRRGRQIGWKQGYKKAVVTLQEGEKIEIQ